MKATIDTQEYYPFLQQIKEKIITARHQAVLAVNSRMIFLYWEIGMYILAQQRVKGWGAKVIDQLSADLKKDFPDMKGLSPRNLKYMRKFADELSPRLIVQQLAALNVIKQASKTYTINHNLFVQHPAALLPWSQNMVLMEKVKSPDEYLFYALKSIENGWSRNVLVHQIEKELHKQQGKITSSTGFRTGKRHI
jgi:predicted nuclease of restriction endonuclease-like (RecB) superfamily